MVTKKRAPYSRWVFVWVVRRMAKPAMAMPMGSKVKRKRCFSRSEKKAMIRAKTKDAAHGGTEWSCVLIWE